MTITKENAKELSRKAAKARKENKERRERFLLDLVMGNGKDYRQKLEELKDDKDLSKNEREFLDRMERNFPYVFAKRAPVNDKGETVEQSLFAPGDAEKILEAYGRANTKGDSDTK